MKNTSKNNTIVIILALIFSSTLYAGGVTTSINATTAFNYQAKVIYNGAPANGPFDIRFSLYSLETGGMDFTSLFLTQNIINGMINAELDFGDLPFNGNDIWMEIYIAPLDVSSGTTLSPRIKINTSPYAIQANFVADNAITTSSVENGSLLGVDLANLSISANQIANFQITNSKIVNHTIGFEKLAPNGASDGDIIQYNGTSNEWESVPQTVSTTPWTDVASGIIYQGNVGIGTGSSFIPDAPLDIRSLLNTSIFKVNVDGTIKRTPRTRVLTLGYQAFTPEKSSFQYEVNSAGTTVGLSNVETSNDNVKLYAPILLPHGVKITKFDLLAFDDDPANQVSASLKLTSFTTNNSSTTLTTVNTGIAPGGIIVASNLDQIYFSTSVFYAFITLPKPGIINTDLIFSGIKITYEIDEL